MELMEQMGKCTHPSSDRGWIRPTSPCCSHYTRLTPEQKRFVTKIIIAYFFVIVVLPIALYIFFMHFDTSVVNSPMLLVGILLVYVMAGPAIILYLLRNRIFR